MPSFALFLKIAGFFWLFLVSAACFVLAALVLAGGGWGAVGDLVDPGRTLNLAAVLAVLLPGVGLLLASENIAVRKRDSRS